MEQNWLRGIPRRALPAVVSAIMLLAGCQMPQSTGLSTTIGEFGTSGTTTLTVSELPQSLRVIGEYNIQEGSLTVTVTDPADETAYEATLAAVATGSIDYELEPAVGDWTLTVSGPPGRGTYEFRLSY